MQVPSAYLASTERVPCKYRARTLQLSSEYQVSISSDYRANTEREYPICAYIRLLFFCSSRSSRVATSFVLYPSSIHPSFPLYCSFLSRKHVWLVRLYRNQWTINMSKHSVRRHRFLVYTQQISRVYHVCGITIPLKFAVTYY